MYEIASELKERPAVFLKFSNNKSILESMQKGNLYLNTLGYFKKCEEVSNTKGMGDKHEGGLLLSNLKISIRSHDNEEVCFEGDVKNSIFNVDDDLFKHILCLSYLDFNNLKIFEEGQDFIKSKIVFSEDQIKEFRSNFGEYVLIISPGDFIERIKQNFEKESIRWIANKVKYDDFSINRKERIESYFNNSNDKYFWKDMVYKNQKEYRIVVLNRDSDIPLQINMGDMSNFSFLATIEDLFNNRYYMEHHFDPKTDLIEL